MITIKSINSLHPDYAGLEALLHTAFPQNERRDDPEQRANADGNPKFNSGVIYAGDKPVGLLTYWDFGDFCYVEHFAIDPDKRCMSYGQQAIKIFIEQVGKPVVLEVELPADETARRRIQFYRRYGFTPWADHAYLQPPYRQGDEPLPMMIMAAGDLNADVDFDRVREKIHSEVYGVK